MKAALLLATLFALCALAAPAPAQPKKGKGTAADPIAVTAEELAKESAADAEKTNKKYQGKFLRVTGTVGAVHDDMLYLPTKVKFPGGTTCDVGIRYPETAKPAVKTGDTATFVGEFTLVAVLGPGLKNCKLVTDKKKP